MNLCPNLTVAENVLIGREPRRGLGIDWKRVNEEAKRVLGEKLGLKIDVTRLLSSYPIAVQQMVAIGRALDIESEILILDEPTSSLDEKESEQLFGVIRKLKAQGLGILFITHFIDQVYAISDRITVLKNGERVGDWDARDLPKLELIRRRVHTPKLCFAFLVRRLSGMDPHTIHSLQNERYLGALLRGSFISRMIGREYVSDKPPSDRQERSGAARENPEVLSVRGLGRKGYMSPFDRRRRGGHGLVPRTVRPKE